MIILHVHKSGIRIRLAVVIPALETSCMPVIDRLAFQKPTEQFQIFLIPAFAFSSSMYKNRPVQTASFFQKPADFLKILGTAFLSYMEPADIILVQKTDCLLNPFVHLCLPFPHRFLPDEGIFIGTGFQFCPINKYGFF